MASQYDSIQTPKELLAKVAMHGFSTQIDDKLRAQDIFGRAPIEDLVELANTAGKTSENFYMVLFSIWHWTDATRFYNQHTNPEIKTMKFGMKADQKYIKELEHKNEILVGNINCLMDENDRAASTSKELEKANLEIMRLKAKLYDMMVAKEEK